MVAFTNKMVKCFLPLLVHAFAAGSPGSNNKVTIAVCTGADCRVDGSTQALKELQTQNASLKDAIRVTGKPCLGPCGDGPCVMVLDKQGNRVVEEQENKLPGSLVPADLFGTNPRGIYQVRTARQVQQVCRMAREAATGKRDNDEESSPLEEDTDKVIVQSTRSIFDRPRNERKVLQRFAQCLVGIGLYQYDHDHGSVGNVQYAIAAVLFLASDLILKEGLFYELKKLLL